MQHSFVAPSHVSSTNPFCDWLSVAVSSQMTSRVVLFLSFLPSCALSASGMIVVSFLPRCFSSPLYIFLVQLRVLRVREVFACQNDFVCCAVFQGCQHESFTDPFGPPDLPLPPRVEQESNSVYVFSTSPSHVSLISFLHVSHRKIGTIVISPHRHQMLFAPLMTCFAQPN